MKNKITILLPASQWKTALRPYRKTVEVACEAAMGSKRGTHELSVVLADDKFIHDLNKTFRGKNKPTNVLSFHGEGKHIGDLVLAYETIKREAKEQGKSFKAHATHLLVHGTLHLLGHDHEREKDATEMERLEIKILKKLKVNNPYL